MTTAVINRAPAAPNVLNNAPLDREGVVAGIGGTALAGPDQLIEPPVIDPAESVSAVEPEVLRLRIVGPIRPGDERFDPRGVEERVRKLREPTIEQRLALKPEDPVRMASEKLLAAAKTAVADPRTTYEQLQDILSQAREGRDSLVGLHLSIWDSPPDNYKEAIALVNEASAVLRP